MKNRLRTLREERRWTQADLAALLGVSRQTVNALEAGRWDPSLPLAFTISELFNESIEAIFVPDRSSPAATPPVSVRSPTQPSSRRSST